MAYTRHTDRELLDLLSAGDEGAYRAIYLRYWQRMYAMAFLRLQRSELAEDVVQDVFTHLWEKRESLSIVSLENWLATAVKYKVISLVNRRLKKELSVEKVPEIIVADEIIDEHLFNQLLQTEINLLPEKCRLVFRYSHEKEMTNKEIAAELSISEKAVEKQITKARKTLRLSLRNFFHSLFL